MPSETPQLTEPVIALPSNVRPYLGPDSLPLGSILQRHYADRNKNPMDLFVEEAAKDLGISTRNSAINYYLRHQGRLYPKGARFGSLVNGLARENEKAFDIAYKMSELEPELSWMRGGSLRIHNGVAILEHSGADGLVGGDVERYARKAYMGEPRINPVIYRILWKDIVDALKSHKFHPGSHHIYDFALLGSVDDPEALVWQQKHLTVYQLEQSK